MDFLDYCLAFVDQCSGIRMRKLVQLGKLQLQHNQQLRGRIVELARNALPLVGPGESLVIRSPARAIVGVVIRRQNASPKQKPVVVTLTNDSKLIHINHLPKQAKFAAAANPEIGIGTIHVNSGN